MASGPYLAGLEGLLGSINLSSDTIKIAAVSTSYTFANSETSMTTAGGTRIGTDQTLGSKTITNGVFDAADATWTAVAGGSTIGGFVVYKFVTNDAGSTPILFIDTTDTATNGGDIVLQFDSGTNKIFKLS